MIAASNKSLTMAATWAAEIKQDYYSMYSTPLINRKALGYMPGVKCVEYVELICTLLPPYSPFASHNSNNSCLENFSDFL
jgi:hypothetical protein